MPDKKLTLKHIVTLQKNSSKKVTEPKTAEQLAESMPSNEFDTSNGRIIQKSTGFQVIGGTVIDENGKEKRINSEELLDLAKKNLTSSIKNMKK